MSKLGLNCNFSPYFIELNKLISVNCVTLDNVVIQQKERNNLCRETWAVGQSVQAAVKHFKQLTNDKLFMKNSLFAVWLSTSSTEKQKTDGSFLTDLCKMKNCQIK